MVYFSNLICPFSTKSLLRLHGFLLTQLFFQSLKKHRKQKTPCIFKKLYLQLAAQRSYAQFLWRKLPTLIFRILTRNWTKRVHWFFYQTWLMGEVAVKNCQNLTFWSQSKNPFECFRIYFFKYQFRVTFFAIEIFW